MRKSITLFLGAFLIILLGWGYMAYERYRAEPIEVQESAKSTESDILSKTSPVPDTANWETYRNEKYGIAFNYPKEFVIQDRMIRSPEESPFFSIFLARDINRENSRIQFIFDRPIEQQKLGNCIFDKTAATQPFKTISTSVGTVVLCTRTMGDIVFFDALIPSLQKGYVHTVDMFSDQRETLQKLNVLEQILSTFRFMR